MRHRRCKRFKRFCHVLNMRFLFELFSELFAIFLVLFQIFFGKYFYQFQVIFGIFRFSDFLLFFGQKNHSSANFQKNGASKLKRKTNEKMLTKNRPKLVNGLTLPLYFLNVFSCCMCRRFFYNCWCGCCCCCFCY